MKPPDRPVLLFDGTCGICTRLAGWAAILARPELACLPSQRPGALEMAGLSREQADASAWLLSPDGTRLAGAAAMNGVLALNPWTRWICRLYAIGPVGRLEERFYAWFARNRGRFSRWGVEPPYPD